MLTFEFPKTGEQISRLGFGLMRLPVLESGKIDYPAASRMVDTAIAGGVNYFDTAHYYHNGESEEFVGKALAKYPRESYYLATKLPTYSLKEPADVDRIFKLQMERCSTDYFDFYLAHSLNRANWQKAKSANMLERLIALKEKGHIRHLGFSFHGDLELLLEVLDAYPWEFAQIQINYIDWKLQGAKAFYDELTKLNIPIVAMEPLRGGALARPPQIAADMLNRADAQRSPAEWAFRWCMGKLPLVLSGMSTAEQLEDNLEIFSQDKPLTEREHALIDEVRDEALKIQTVPCTGCAYCMACPSGVDIPGVFGLYNIYKLFNGEFEFWQGYNDMGDRAAKSCTTCGACVPKCPQNIDIPDWLSKIHAEASAFKF